MKYWPILIIVALACILAEFVHRWSTIRREMRVAVIPKTTATDYWESLHAGVADAGKGKIQHILWIAMPSETDARGQAQLVENAIQARVSAIILAPAQESVLASSVRHANAERIPVVIVDSPISVPASEYLASIESDRQEIGQFAADRIGKILGGHGEVGLIAVSPTVQSSEECRDAFVRRLHANFPAITVAGVEYGLADAQRSKVLALDAIRAHPGLGAIFALDSFATRGHFAGLTQECAKCAVKLVGVAQELDMIAHLKDGQIDSLILQDPYGMGKLAIETILGNNRSSAAGIKIRTPVVLATREDIDYPRIQQLWSHYLSTEISAPAR